MEGAHAAQKERLDLAMWTAWHTEAFARMKGPAFKHALSDYLARGDKPANQKLSNAKGIAFFNRLKARGVDVNITRH